MCLCVMIGSLGTWAHPMRWPSLRYLSNISYDYYDAADAESVLRDAGASEGTDEGGEPE